MTDADGGAPRVACGGCGHAYPWKPKYAGKRAQCRRCGHTMRMPEHPPGAEPVAEAEEAMDYELADTGGESSARGGSGWCPSCGAEMGEGAVLCVSCGYNIQTGEKVGGAMVRVDSIADGAERAQRAGLGGWTLGLMAGAAAALFGGVLWGVIAKWTGMELGVVAWVIGALTGGMVAGFAKDHTASLGVAAAGLALGGLLIGKILLMQWAAPDLVAKEMVDNPFAILPVVIWDTAREEGQEEVADYHARTMARFIMAGDDLGEALGEVSEMEEPEGMDTQAMEAIGTKAVQRAENMNEAEKEDASRRFFGAVIGHLSYGERIKLASSPFDLLWFGLALFSAFKLSSSGSES